MAESRPGTVHYTKLQPWIPGSPHAREYEVYRREVGQFLAEGREGQFVLIDGENVVGFWPTFQEGVEAGRRHGLADPFVYQVLTEHRILRIGYNKLWRN
jgi:hypothetical protein